MDLTVEEFLKDFYTEGSKAGPKCDKPQEDTLELPPWFNKAKYKRGQEFILRNSYSMFLPMFCGAIMYLSVPSKLKIFMSTGRSSDPYTAYKRYMATMGHVYLWLICELEPGSDTWRSFQFVRRRHFTASVASRACHLGFVTQRDMTITLVSLICIQMLVPKKLRIYGDEEDWDGFNHFWATIGYMTGIEDRFNAFRPKVDDTRKIVGHIKSNVFTPNLEIVPEGFEHMVQALLQGVWIANPLCGDALIFFTKYLNDVPGYVHDEEQRVQLIEQIKEVLKRKGLTEKDGVNTKDLIPKSMIPADQTTPDRYIYLKDFDTLAEVPAFKELTRNEKFKVKFIDFSLVLVNYYLGRIILNFLLYLSLFVLARYFPITGMLKYGFRKGFVDIFGYTPVSRKPIKSNSEIYIEKELLKNK